MNWKFWTWLAQIRLLNSKLATANQTIERLRADLAAKTKRTKH
jgi:hypothetical protein